MTDATRENGQHTGFPPMLGGCDSPKEAGVPAIGIALLQIIGACAVLAVAAGVWRAVVGASFVRGMRAYERPRSTRRIEPNGASARIPSSARPVLVSDRFVPHGSHFRVRLRKD
jgi:hypothetical protein